MAKFDTRHRTSIDNIVAGTEDAPRYVLAWDEARGDDKIHCRIHVCSRQLARKIIYDLFMADDCVSKINLTPIS